MRNAPVSKTLTWLCWPDPYTEPMVLAVRILHGLISCFFLICLIIVWQAGITNQPTLWSTLAATALLIESFVIVFNKGNCPLGALHRRLGDDHTFFGLFLPPHLAREVIPTVGILTIIGLVVLA